MPDIRIVSSPEELAAQAADFIIQSARDSVARQGRFTLAFTGGSTPEQTYSLLAKPERAGQIEWDKAFLFWGDDRFVPPDDERSNFGMTARALLQYVPVPEENLYPMPVETDTPAQGADYYADTLAQFFGLPAGSREPPQFDLILLGLGDDGHVASLFPGFPTLDVTDRWTVWSHAGTLPPPVDRISVTFPVLNAARQVLFLVAGDKKAEAVQDILEGNPPRQKRPGAGVRPTDGTVTWLLDPGAASRLRTVNARPGG